MIPAIGTCREVSGILKVEVTLRASSFTKSHKSSNCKHDTKGQVRCRISHSGSRPTTKHPHTRRLAFLGPEGRGHCS